MKVFIVFSSPEYANMFIRAGWDIAKTIEEADLVQFTGGADVSPELYGEKNAHSYVSVDRDLSDLCAFRQALALGKPMAGICRGGQFLNVMSGGKMVQHVEGHANGKMHKAEGIVYPCLNKIDVTSTHHQMMVPGINATVLMVADIVGYADTEAVFYPNTMALCFQPHPEFPGADECRKVYFNYLNEFFFG